MFQFSIVDLSRPAPRPPPSRERLACKSSHRAPGDSEPFSEARSCGEGFLCLLLSGVVRAGGCADSSASVQPLEWPLISPIRLHSPIQETTPGTKALSSTLRSWTHQAAHPQCRPRPHRPLASLSSLRLPRPRALGAATHPATRRPPRVSPAQVMPSACWTRSCSAWVGPGGANRAERRVESGGGLRGDCVLTRGGERGFR